jgi:signal transduction histidine kinase
MVDSRMQLTVEQRLKIESLRRGINGTFPQCTALICMLVFIPPFHALTAYQLGCWTLLLILILRWVIIKKICKSTETLVKRFPLGVYLGLSTAVLWAFLNSLAIYWFGMDSHVGLIHVYMTCGLTAAVMYSLAPTPKIQRIYILILGLTVSVVIYFTETTGFQFSGGVLFIFVMYLFFASRGHSSDLRTAFEFEQKLLVENTKLQEVVDSVPGFMIIISEDGKWLHSSRSSQEMMNSKKLKNEIQDFLKSGQAKGIKELELTLQGEHCFVVSFERSSSVAGGVIVFGLPIDDLNEVRKELEIQKAKADYSARLAGIGVLASGVAHEINNPLAIISMNTETLGRKLAEFKVDESIWKKRTKTIVETVHRIATIIQSLQQLSREDVQPQSIDVDLNIIIKNVIDVSLERLKNIGAELHYDEQGPLLVKGNHVDWGQVLISLVNNSFDAIKDTQERKITIDAKKVQDEIILEIQDTGEGISKEVEKQLFQPFFSTKPVGSGSGLGLSISRSIVMANDGSLTLVNAKNPTIFQIKIKNQSH